jgi:hypothetical protein
MGFVTDILAIQNAAAAERERLLEEVARFLGRPVTLNDFGHVLVTPAEFERMQALATIPDPFGPNVPRLYGIGVEVEGAEPPACQA